MPYQKKPGIVQFHVDCSAEAKLRFASLHEALGFKTKTATFEAIVYAMSINDKIDPHILERIESKLDRFLERMEALI